MTRQKNDTDQEPKKEPDGRSLKGQIEIILNTPTIVNDDEPTDGIVRMATGAARRAIDDADTPDEAVANIVKNWAGVENLLTEEAAQQAAQVYADEVVAAVTDAVTPAAKTTAEAAEDFAAAAEELKTAVGEAAIRIGGRFAAFGAAIGAAANNPALKSAIAAATEAEARRLELEASGYPAPPSGLSNRIGAGWTRPGSQPPPDFEVQLTEEELRRRRLNAWTTGTAEEHAIPVHLAEPVLREADRAAMLAYVLHGKTRADESVFYLPPEEGNETKVTASTLETITREDSSPFEVAPTAVQLMVGRLCGWKAGDVVAHIREEARFATIWQLEAVTLKTPRANYSMNTNGVDFERFGVIDFFVRLVLAYYANDVDRARSHLSTSYHVIPIDHYFLKTPVLFRPDPPPGDAWVLSTT